ncbi:MAG: glucuronate isomerase, partial [Firmicutes bacterium]|nr:glucuronate isomerase [Bacillota bacterium]
DPFDPIEHKLWQEGGTKDARFRAALRVDPLLNDFPKACSDLEAWGYKVEPSLNEQTVEEVKRFLREWLEKINGLYLAASLPCNFTMPDESIRGQLIEKCILPACAALNVPFAMMIGTKRQVNPELRLAGDSLGKSDIKAVEYLCAKYPANKFLVTLLSRENQHELAITARKFRNLMVFGCWWFLNNPSIIEEITRMRVETLGLAFIPQHSDARVIEQLIYKWDHSKQIIGKVLLDKYTDLLETGWQLTQDEIARDISDLFGGNFWKFIEK